MKIIQLTAQLPEREVEKKAGTLLTENDYDILVGGEDTTVYKPDGTILCIYLHKAIPEAVLKLSEGAFQAASKSGDLTNRGMAVAGHHAPLQRRKDGSVDSTNRVDYADLEHMKGATSGIIGYMDANARFPYCRTTAYTAQELEKFTAMYPYVEAVHRLFGAYMPDRHAAQENAAAQTHPTWLIPQTCFTTLTVNRNWQTAVHTDKGDLEAGFGTMGVLGNGLYSGCNFVYPRYRIAVDIRRGDQVINDVHEWHGNTAFVPLLAHEQDAERVSIVHYYREKMMECADPQEEDRRRRKFFMEDPARRSYASTSIVNNALVQRPDLGVHLAVMGGAAADVAKTLALFGPANWYVPASKEADFKASKAGAVIAAPSYTAALNRALEDAFAADLLCLILSGKTTRFGKHVRNGIVETSTLAAYLKELLSTLRVTPYKAASGTLGTRQYAGDAADLSSQAELSLTGLLVLPNPLRFDALCEGWHTLDFSMQHIDAYRGVLRLNYLRVEPELKEPQGEAAYGYVQQKWLGALRPHPTVPLKLTLDLASRVPPAQARF